MKRFGIVEVGSTFSKGYVVEEGVVTTVGMVSIPLKRNYEDHGEVAEEDIVAISSYVTELQEQTNQVFVYGTSIFRSLNAIDLARVQEKIELLTGADFRVVSAAEESALTCYGAIAGIAYHDALGVMVGGGGSTEVAVYQKGVLREEALSNFGVGDVNRAFPDLSNDVATTQPQEVTDWITQRLRPISMRASILVLAGGNFPLLYENAGYPLEQNPHTNDPEKQLFIGTAAKRARDAAYFSDLSLETFRALTPDTPSWWDGTRAMCCFVDAVARQLGASYLVPTRISMVYGIAAKLS